MPNQRAKQRYAWIYTAAEERRLGLVDMEHKETGEVASFLVAVFDSDDGEDFNMFPLARVLEQLNTIVDEWKMVGTETEEDQ
jgi:hypothetical protein